MTEKVTLKDVVFDKLNKLENEFNEQNHLNDDLRPSIGDQLAWMSKMWPILSETDREWVQAAQFAFEDKLPWK